MRKLISILFLLISLAGFSQHHMMHTLAGQSTPCTPPTYVSTTTTSFDGRSNNNSGSNLNSACMPAILVSGDFVFFAYISTGTQTYPSDLNTYTGATLVGSISGSNMSAGFYGYVSDGTEDGATTYVTYSSGTNDGGFQSGTSGRVQDYTNFESNAYSTQLSGSSIDVNVTKNHDNSLLILIGFIEDDTALTSWTGTNWSSIYYDNDNLGTDAGVFIATYEECGTGTVPTFNYTIGTAEFSGWCVIEVWNE